MNPRPPTPRCAPPGPHFLTATGPLADAMRRHDWTGTPLGGPGGWPQPLRTLLSIMLGSRQPMFVMWGPQRTLLYNDAYAPVLGRRHPAALGRGFFDVWTELRELLVPLVERVFSGASVHMDDIHLTVERNGFAEDTHFAFSYTPVPDAEGTVVGLFCVCTETTAQVQAQEALRAAEARQAFRVELSDALRAERDPQALMATAAAMLGRHLQTGCIGYGEIDASGEIIRVDRNWTAPGVAGVVGTHRLAHFGPRLMDELHAGHTVRINDVATHPLLKDAPDVQAAYAAVGMRSGITAPLVKDGRLAVALFVLHPGPRTWTPHEQALVEEVAERTWASLQKLRAEEALAESEARARGIFRRLQSGLVIGEVVRDDEGRAVDWRYLEVNPAWEALLGVRAETALGRTMTEVFPQVDRQWVRDFIAVAETGEPLTFAREGLSGRWFEGHAFGIEPERFAVSFIDITERRNAEAALKDVMANLEQLVEARTRERNRVWENSRDLLVVVGADGILRDASPSWTAILGHPVDEVIGRSAFDFIHPDDVESTCEALIDAASSEVNGFENRFLHRDGTPRWISWYTSLENGTIFAYGRDVTLRRQQAEALREAEAQLRQSQKMEAVGQLTGGVAHDFNNILQVVSGNLQLIARAAAGDEKVQRRVANAQGAVARGARLSSQLLAFGRRQPLEPRVVHAGRLLAGMDDMLRRALGEGVDVETRVHEGVWNTFVDPVQLENALLNLAINGRDAMEGWGRLSIEVANASLDAAYARAHADATAGDYVVLVISDSGSGMTPEVLARAFEPFFSTKPVDKGTGLGLSMVYGFARQSGGHVRIYSEPGAGTTVRLYLPRARAAEDPVAAAPGEAVAGGSETILVAEDDEAVRSTVVEMLGDLGYGVLVANDASAAWAIVESGARIDLLFTDVVMPGEMRSPVLAARVRERLPDARVLYTSGYPEDQIVHGGRLDAGVELLPKPYTRETLARKVRQVLDQPTTR